MTPGPEGMTRFPDHAEKKRECLWTPAEVTAIHRPVFRRSSAVEQLTVNQLVVGSIPTAGASSFLTV